MLQLLWALVLLLNVGALVVFGYDKWRSRGAGRRVPERVLLWFVFLGGWIGAWLAMSWFRHKTVKQPFKTWAILWTLLSPFWLLVWWSWHDGFAG
jgi:uncharacterized membrane protein YsdA (DUF1294 family)